MTGAGLSNEQRLAVTAFATSPPTTVRSLSGASPAGDDSELQRQCAEIMVDIQTVAQGNIELIARYDERIRSLEAELASTRLRQAATSGRAAPEPMSEWE